MAAGASSVTSEYISARDVKNSAGAFTRTLRTVRPEESGFEVTWKDLLVPSNGGEEGPSGKFGVGWMVEKLRNPSSIGWRHVSPIEPDRIIANLQETASYLTNFLASIQAVQATVTCGLRLPEHNAYIGKERSRHQYGEAVDLDNVKVREAGGSVRTLRPWEVSARAFFDGQFERCFYYNGKRTFAHLGSKGSPSRWNHQSGDGPNPRPPSNDGISSFSEISPPDPLSASGTARGGMGGGTPSEEAGEVYDGPSAIDIDVELGEAPESVMRALNSAPGMEGVTAKDYTYDQETRRGGFESIAPPGPGEIDIGDFRFGSKFEGFSDPGEPEDRRNQVTSASQQSHGNTMGVRMLRAEQAPPIAARQDPKEIVATVAVNATDRAEINGTLRPFMAMLRRHPIVACRSKELSRLMLGITGASDVAEELEQAFPGMRSSTAEERAQDIVSGEGGVGSIWVPCAVRSVSVKTAEGASGLFYVNVAMQRATVGPYVPQMMYWRDTARAVEWAQHQQARGQLWAEPIDIDSSTGGAVVESPDGTQTKATVPNLTVRGSTGEDADWTQTPNPRESHVFRKFYRGLLQEDHDAGRAYPTSIPDRVWEPYDPSARMDLSYSAPVPERGRGELLSGVIEGLDQRRIMAEELDAAVSLYNTEGSLDKFNEMGRYNGIYIGLGRDFNTLVTGAKDVVRRVRRAVESVRPVAVGRRNAPSRISSMIYDSEAEGGVRAADLGGSSISEAAGAADLLRTPGLGYGEASGFTVPDPDSDLNVGIGTIFNRLQKSVLSAYADQIEDLSESNPTSGNSSFHRYLSEEMRRAAQSAGEAEGLGLDSFQSTWLDYSGGAPVFDSSSGSPFAALSEEKQAEIKQGFGTGVLSPRFMFPLAGRGDNVPDFRRRAGNVPEPLLRIEALVEHSENLTKKIAQSVQSIRGDLEGYAAGAQEGQVSGTLELEAAELKSIQVSFAHHFDWEEWEAWSGPVPQHMGSSPMEITMDISASDELVKDQLGEMEKAQQSLASIRQEGNAAPPLVNVGGEGNLLRALGIKNVTYRSHTERTSSEEAGWTNVQLSLGQDENSLSKYERIWEASLQSENLFPWKIAEPLALPVAQDVTAANRNYPVSALTLLEKVYQVSPSGDWAGPDEIDRSISGESDGLSGTQTDSKYGPKSLRGGERAWERVAAAFQEQGVPESVQAEYNLKSGEFETWISFSGRPGRVRVDLSPLLRRWNSFISFAERRLEEQGKTEEWIGFVQFVNGTLSTSGSGDGWILTLLQVAFVQLALSGQIRRSLSEELISSGAAAGAGIATVVGLVARAAASPVTDFLPAVFGSEGQGQDLREDLLSIDEWGSSTTRGIFREADSGLALPKVMSDNLTRIAHQLSSSPEGLGGGTSMAGRLFSREAKSIGSRLARGPIADVYADWISYDRKASREFRQVREAMKDLEGLLPSCHRDTLLKDVKDERGRSLIGWDFPFGPGRETLEQEKSLNDYRFAEAKRREANMQLATVGLETMLTDVAGQLGGEFQEIDKSQLQDSSGSTSTTKSGSEAWKIGDTWYEWTGDPDTEQGRRYQKMYQGTVNYLTDQVGETSATLPDQDFVAAMEEIRRKGGFRANPGQLKELNNDDWLKILQISRTIRYVTAVGQVASEDLEEGLSSFEGDNYEKEIYEKLSQLGRQGTTSRLQSDQAMIMSSFSKAVQSSEWLAQERENLIRLYNAEPSIVSEVLGWTDPSGEKRRQERMRELRRQWKGAQGMRRVFPSYQILILGNARQGGFELLEDVYSYAAARRIEMNSAAKQAGSYGFLELSNLRRSVGTADQSGGLLATAFRGKPEETLQLKEGNHIQVSLGYGPDRSCLEPLTGRITSVEHGDISRVEVSSYSTSTLNPPNQGQGLFTSGKDATYTLAGALLFSIAATQGLEGLGRHQIGGSDELGRGARGGAEDDYRLGLAASLHRALGRPGVTALLGGDGSGASGTNEKAAAEVFTAFEDLAADVGLDEAKQYMIGGKLLYENIYVQGVQGSAGLGDLVMGSVDELFEGGRGFSWSSMPGTPLWTIMQKMAKWRPGYVVGSRPYNRGVPLSDLSDHRPRETLYFGPKNGQYKATSYEEGQGSLGKLGKKKVDQILENEYSKGSSQANLRKLYEEVFWWNFLLPLIGRTAQETSAPWVDAWNEWIENEARKLTTMGEDFFEATSGFSSLDKRLPAPVVRSIMNTIKSVWGEEFARSHRFYRDWENGQFLDEIFPGEQRTVGWMVNGFAPPSYWEAPDVGELLNVSSGDIETQGLFKRKGRTTDQRLGGDGRDSYGREWDHETVDQFDEYGINFNENVLESFRKAIKRLASSGGGIGANIAGGGDLLDNPVLSSIKSELEESGYRPGETYRPFRQQHFLSSLDNLCSAEVEASSTNQGFANTINLEWPAEGQSTLAAYQPDAKTNTFTVSAAPTLLPEAVVQSSIYAPNLRTGLNESVNNFADMRTVAEGRAQSEDPRNQGGSVNVTYSLPILSESRGALAGSSKGSVSFNTKTGAVDLTGQESGGDWVENEPRAKAFQEVNNRLQTLIDAMKGPDSLIPKFETVGVSLLSDSLRYMYSGSLLMPGDPSIRPYDVVHVYAPEKKLFGPAEVEEVSTVYGIDSGFKTSVKPAMLNEQRGVDATMDTSWFYQAGRYQSTIGKFERIASSIGTTVSSSAYYSSVGAAAGWIGGGLGLIGSSAAAGFSAGGVYGAAAGVGLGLLNALREAGSEKSRAFVGTMAQVTSANPLIFHPLNQYGEPLVAGMKGAIGPSTIRSAEISRLNRASSAGDWSAGFFGLMERLDGGNIWNSS